MSGFDMVKLLELIDSTIFLFGIYIVLTAISAKIMFPIEVDGTMSLNYYNREKLKNFGYYYVPLKLMVSYEYNGISYDKEIYAIVDSRFIGEGNKFKLKLMLNKAYPDKCIQRIDYRSVIMKGFLIAAFGFSLIGILYGG